jgi:hypothetical protein
MVALRMTQDATIQKVALVDDESNDALLSKEEVKAAGFEPIAIHQRFRKIEEFAAFIQSEAQGALCAHRLAGYGFTYFYGAKLVASLYDLKIPALLVTQYTDIDGDVSIRKWRDKIPVLLSPDEANADSILTGMSKCASELRGNIPPSRKPHRTLLRVVHVTSESNEKVIDVIIPGWNPHKAVRFPASLLPADLQDIVVPKVRLFAQVNIGARRSDDLYFREFELAEEPDEDDGLA